MLKMALRLRKEPLRAFCLGVVGLLAVFFVFDVASRIARLDFHSSNLGKSPVTDFFAYYAGARFLLAHGPLSALYDPEAFRVFQASLGTKLSGTLPFIYPPTYALLILPLGLLPYPAAFLLWQAVTLGLFAISLRKAGLTAAELTATLIAPAAIVNMAAGQNGFLTSALLVGGMALLTSRPLSAGSLFGLLTFKPQLGLLLPVVCFARRRWRTIASAVVVVSCFVALSVAVEGFSAWTAYFDRIGWFRATAEAQAYGPFMSVASAPYMIARLAGLPAGLAYMLQGLIALYVVGTVYAAWRRYDDPKLQLALLMAGTCLATPYGFLYDTPMVAAAVVLAASCALRDGFMPYEAVWLLAVFFAPFLSVQVGHIGPLFVPLLHFVLFVGIGLRLRKFGQRSGDPQAITGKPHHSESYPAAAK